MCSITLNIRRPGADDVNVAVSDGPLQARWRRRGVEVRRAAAAIFETEDGHRDGTGSNDLALLDRPRTGHGPTVRRRHHRHSAPSSATNITTSSPSQRSQHDHHLHDPYRRHQSIHRHLEQQPLPRDLTCHHHPDPPNIRRPTPQLQSVHTCTKLLHGVRKLSGRVVGRPNRKASGGTIGRSGTMNPWPVTSFASGPRRSSSPELSLRPTMMSRSRSTVEFSTLLRR